MGQEFNRAAWALLNETMNTVSNLLDASAEHTYLVQFAGQAEARSDLAGQLDKMQRTLLALSDSLYEHGQKMDAIAIAAADIDSTTKEPHHAN